MTVQLVDDEAGAPAADVPWFVIATGSEDRGRLEGLGPEEPNPKPLAHEEAITDAKGQFELSLRGHDRESCLINEMATCVAQPWRDLQVTVRGISLAESLLSAHVLLENGDGQEVRLPSRGRQGEWTLFSGRVPAGTWTLRSGPVVHVPTQHLEIPAVYRDEIVRVETAGP